MEGILGDAFDACLTRRAIAQANFFYRQGAKVAKEGNAVFPTKRLEKPTHIASIFILLCFFVANGLAAFLGDLAA